MRRRYDRFHSVGRTIGSLLVILGLILLIPTVVCVIFWGEKGDGWQTLQGFLIAAFSSSLTGILLRVICKRVEIDGTGSMLICGLGWLCCSIFGGIPFVIGGGTSFLDGYFEAMSGFTTTGFTVFTNLDTMPRSIVFWRALSQFVGGLGILSFFLIVTFRGGGAHHLIGAEGHKIASSRPAPGIFSTLKILWGVYGGLVIPCAVLLALVGMPVFDAICHAFATMSTGGFSTHDASIAHYRTGDFNFRQIEYTITFFMMLGGINVLVLYRVFKRDLAALKDSLEIRWFWGIIAGFTLLITAECLRQQYILRTGDWAWSWMNVEEVFRNTIFQVISLLTSTGFATQDIGGSYFSSMAQQLFLVAMVVGGCVGSTSGGFKVLRVAILNRLIFRELFKLRIPQRAVSPLVVDGGIVPENEVHRVCGLFSAWIGLILFGGAITAVSMEWGAWESLSGMASAMGNMGPCYIPGAKLAEMNWVVKITYILGMLAGRLEILPVLLLFQRRAWTH